MAAAPRFARIALFLAVFCGWPSVPGARAQSTAANQAAPPPPEPFQISDNSFLVEEAFNQEAGVFQNIFTVFRTAHSWSASFTQEWPVRSQAHQFSYTLQGSGGDGVNDWSDALLNYRFQALMEGPGRPAFSPRVSAILPTGSERAGHDVFGVQFNLPFSKQVDDFYFHWNAGLTWLPSVDFDGGSLSLESPFLSASAIYRVAPMLHGMLELVGNFNELPDGSSTTRVDSYTISPGGRGGWNIGDHQLILGVAMPLTWTEGERRQTAVFVYASYELPFKK
jgi:hypothetical protein